MRYAPLDDFLEKVDAVKAAAGLRRVATIGVGFDEQIVDSIPMNSHDR
jgi:5-formyltetrahydrofolate cyclo-ligase